MPVWLLTAWTVSSPSAVPSSLGEIGWLGPVLTQDCAAWPCPAFLKSLMRLDRPLFNMFPPDAPPNSPSSPPARRPRPPCPPCPPPPPSNPPSIPPRPPVPPAPLPTADWSLGWERPLSAL